MKLEIKKVGGRREDYLPDIVLPQRMKTIAAPPALGLSSSLQLAALGQEEFGSPEVK